MSDSDWNALVNLANVAEAAEIERQPRPRR